MARAPAIILADVFMRSSISFGVTIKFPWNGEKNIINDFTKCFRLYALIKLIQGRGGYELFKDPFNHVVGNYRGVDNSGETDGNYFTAQCFFVNASPWVAYA